jgi:hypothetical protein
MIAVQRGVPSEAVRQGARHVLFVDGHGDGSFDPSVLKALVDDLNLDVRPLGPSRSLRAAAEALHPHHPTYYFLIDRDHHDDETVEQSWKDFPDPGKSNLLLWRRKELESYFILPEYLSGSSYCRRTRTDVERELVLAARPRVWLDIVNHVIVSIREDMKAKWIEMFDSVTGFETRAGALQQLKRRSEFPKKRKADARMLSPASVEERFERAREDFLDGERLELGKGRWLEHMSGKELFARLVGGRCFEVLDRKNRKIEGSLKRLEVAKDLLRQDRRKQPRDFQELYRLLARSVR